MLLRWVLTVLTERYISVAISAVLSISDACASTSRSRALSRSTTSGAGSAGTEGFFTGEAIPGLITSGSHRTGSVECIESGHVLTINYDRVRELYFDNPEFGFYFLRLIGERLLQNLKRTEELLAAEREKHLVVSS